MNTLECAPSNSKLSSATRGLRPRKAAPPVPVVLAANASAAKRADSSQAKIIVARINVGWGNTVYLRGEGGCLNWDLGVPMICSGEDRWIWCCHADEAPRQFKFLRNDREWALGDNEVMSNSDVMVCSPSLARWSALAHL